MKKFADLVTEARQQVDELFPWDVDERMQADENVLLLDVREECEFSAYHIAHSMLVPRGILETACEEEYEDAVPELIAAREREIILICRSGNRSLLAAQTMQIMGYRNVKSMQTGLRGWNDYELPLRNVQQEIVDPDEVDEMLNAGFCSQLMHPDRRTIID
ncbi:MAG: rhodanese-like domain-containing protein [Gammaproteobacteria bacterium]|jgi:rhodanese-related sulfurtransferase|nr:rhodanese-like domain-containing protein [Gammaproteobacteria bacterium]